MRHSDISTTLAFYVGEDGEAIADALWNDQSNNLGNDGPRKENADYSRRMKATTNLD
jgi:hypothetical protein